MRAVRTLQTPSGGWIGTEHASGGPRPLVGDIGCLMLNFGHMPRSGVGDLSVHLADHFASSGVTTWRFDFPGLGDSPGETPAAERVLFRRIQAGRYVEPCLELVRELRATTGIERWILGGLCGGAVTTVLAAQHCREILAGMLLIDLDVSLLPEMECAAAGDPGEQPTLSTLSTADGPEPSAPMASTPGQKKAANGRGGSSYAPFLQRLFSRRTWIRFATGEGRLGGRLPGLRKVVGRALSTGTHPELPPDRNQPVIEALCTIVDGQLPVLSIRAKGKMRDLYSEAVDQVCFRDGLPAHYRVLRLDGTNHVFTSGAGEASIVSAIGGWLGLPNHANGHLGAQAPITSGEVRA